MTIRLHPSQAEIKSVLTYNPLTGEWIWLKRTPGMFITTIRKSRGEISPEMNCQIWNGRWAGKLAGSIDDNGYLVIRFGDHQYKAHILAVIYMTGVYPKMVDHADLNRSNNKWDNLRPATRSQNNSNVGPRKTNKLGVKGVCRKGSKFQARLSVDGKCHYLGKFSTLDEATEAVANAAALLHGDFAHSSTRLVP